MKEEWANLWEVTPPVGQGSSTSHSAVRSLVIHGQSEVEWLESGKPDKASISLALDERFNRDLQEVKSINFLGGFEQGYAQSSFLQLDRGRLYANYCLRGHYARMLVISICSQKRHSKSIQTISRSQITPASDLGALSLDQRVLLALIYTR